MAFSDLAHSQLRSLYGLSTGDVTHATLDTRPSRFSACNIEKLGVAWGRGYTYTICHQYNIYNGVADDLYQKIMKKLF